MAFQVVELILDADDSVIERRVVPYPYQTRAEAVDTIESVMTRFAEAGYEPDGDFWWAINGNGKTRVRFIIEHSEAKLRRGSKPDIKLDVRDDDMIVTLPGTSYTVTYYKPANSQQLLAKKICQWKMIGARR